MNAADLKSLLDTRMKTGTVQVAVLDGIGTEMLDPIEARLTIAQQIKDPLTTTRPEDIRAKYDVPGSLTGAALQAEVDKRRSIGDIRYVQAAVEVYLKATYVFAGTPVVVVTPHRDLANARFDDMRTATIRIPIVDDNGTAIPLTDAGLIAEIDRVIPKWHYTVVNTTASRSAPYIKQMNTSQTKHNWATLKALPESFFQVEASSEDSHVVDRFSRQLYWMDISTVLEKADNIIDGENTHKFGEVPGAVRVEASSTLVDRTRVISEQIEVPTNILKGFEDEDPNIGGGGITGIAAQEITNPVTLDIEDSLVSLGESPSVTMLEPLEEHTIDVLQEIRLLSNDKKGENLLGEVLIFHQLLGPTDGLVLKLAGRNVRVFAAPLNGSGIKDNIVSDNVDLPEQFVGFDPTDNKLIPPTKEFEYARTYLDGSSDREIDRVPKTLKSDLEFDFTTTISGVSPGSQQHPLPGAESPGLISIFLGMNGGGKGSINNTGIPPLRKNQVINIQKITAEPDYAIISIKQNTGGGVGGVSPNTFTEGLAQISAKPSYATLPNAGQCRTLAMNFPNFANLFSFSSSAATAVDMMWIVDVHVEGVYDLIELADPAESTDVDTTYLEFSPDQTYTVVNTRIDNMPGNGFLLGERRIKDLFDKSIVIHELKYDANKIPKGGVQLRAFCTYDITSEQNAQTISIDIPAPNGFITDKLVTEVKMGVFSEQIVINLSDPDQIVKYPGRSIFKSVRLDALVDQNNSIEKTISSVILFYDNSYHQTDALIKPSAHFTPWDTSLIPRRIEDLSSLTFNSLTVLPIASWSHTLPAGSVWDTFFTEDKTGDILDDPVGKFVTGGIIYYWANDLDEDGQLVEVFVKYANAPVTPYPEDLAILSVSVPEGHVVSFRVANLTPKQLFYIDDLGIIRSVIDSYDIKTLEILYDTNTVPEHGAFVEVYATYGLPTITSNAAEDLLSFSVRGEVKVKAVQFTGLTPLTVKYVTRDEGIVDSLSKPEYLSAVLVDFKQFTSSADKVMIQFVVTYLKNLKVIEYPVRQDWEVTAINPVLPTPSTLIAIKSVWARGEFDKFWDINYGGVSSFRTQRLSKVRMELYDADLSTDTGRYTAINLGMNEIQHRRANPFIPDPGYWASPSGQDEQFRIDIQGVSVNRIVVTGTTSTPSPIRVIDQGYEKPFVNGVTYEPTSILLFYSRLDSVELYYDRAENVHDTHRYNVLFDDSAIWKSNDVDDVEYLEIIANSAITANQVIAAPDSSSVAISKVRMSVGGDAREMTTVEYTPASTTTSARPYNKDDTIITVISTVGFANYQLVDIGGIETVRIAMVRDATTLIVDPLSQTIPASSTVTVVGYDFGEPVSMSYCRLDIAKSAVGSVALRAIIPKIERRFSVVDSARNVIAPDATWWSSSSSENATQEAQLRMWFEQPAFFNRMDIAEDIESAPEFTYLDAYTDTEKQMFFSKEIGNRGFLNRTKADADSPESEPVTIQAKSLTLKWDQLPRDPNTGLYQTKVTKCIPEFVYDAARSYPKFALDGNVFTRWSSTDTANPLDVVTAIFDLGAVYPVDRVLIYTPSVGTSATLSYSLGDHPSGYQAWGNIVDIGAASATVTQSLTLDAGPGSPPATQVTVASTAGFDVGRFVNVRDNVSPGGIGEFRKIATLSPTVITFTPGLALDYTVANSALVEQSNIICPGWYPPIVVGQACVGGHIVGPASFSDAFVLPLVEARYIKMEFTNLALEPGTGLYNVRLNHVDIFQSVTVL